MAGAQLRRLWTSYKDALQLPIDDAEYLSPAELLASLRGLIEDWYSTWDKEVAQWGDCG